ncbi:hypothetical protein HOD20_06500 [archaeon]|jgi:predicted nucleotidyltransferase|nr:hypothetical protein [archaeon]MBT4352153.1 hypothetical protein [archaeon]MBT4648283.1 hypothetical protein [archaeon]MBT6821535.1 hypothetical protein [archaeon]MBT7391934.1 hypothetical protein [archaeon]
MLTDNQKKVLRYLIINQDNFPSINQVAKDNNLAPNGALKILNKFKEEGILKIKQISNIKAYYINYNNNITRNFLELALITKIEDKKIKNRINDLISLKNISNICILFGSYIEKNKKPNDLDILFVLKKENFTKYKKQLNELKNIIPITIHDMILTKEDLIQNIKMKKPIILNIIKNGYILWGHSDIVEVLINVNKR